MSIEDSNCDNWPISRSELEELCEWLVVDCQGECDGTLRRTKSFLRSIGRRNTEVISWLEQHGGYCDCEVVLNVGRPLLGLEDEEDDEDDVEQDDLDQDASE
jgi:hypothetical protein